jgi:hypothetical protein
MPSNTTPSSGSAPSAFSTRTGMIFASGATPATPVPLPVTAAAMPATCVPCPFSSCGLGQPSFSFT